MYIRYYITFLLSKFAIVAVRLEESVLEKYLKFFPKMPSLVTALYLVFDQQ